MDNQSQDYENLEMLKDALVQERRTLIQEWRKNARSVDAPDLGEKVQSIQASLEAVSVAMNEERSFQGIVGFV